MNLNAIQVILAAREVRRIGQLAGGLRLHVRRLQRRQSAPAVTRQKCRGLRATDVADVRRQGLDLDLYDVLQPRGSIRASQGDLADRIVLQESDQALPYLQIDDRSQRGAVSGYRDARRIE